jgi:hypothetical protein
MGILVWTLGFPTVATVLAIIWVMWSSRPRGPAEPHESVAEHERFTRALAAPLATRRVPSARPRPPAASASGCSPR